MYSVSFSAETSCFFLPVRNEHIFEIKCKKTFGSIICHTFKEQRYFVICLSKNVSSLFVIKNTWITNLKKEKV